MRDNGTVTQQEYLLTPDTIIVSKTDTLGNIIEANEAFIDTLIFQHQSSKIYGRPFNLESPGLRSSKTVALMETITGLKPTPPQLLKMDKLLVTYQLEDPPLQNRKLQPSRLTKR